MSVTTDVDGGARVGDAVASDADLLAAVHGGDETAYGELFDRHATAARRFARSLGASPDEADDLVSEAFAKVLAAIRGGSGPQDAFRPYLLTSIRRLSWREGERRDDPTDDDDLGRLVAPADLGAEDPDTSIALDAFLTLPERWQTVLWHTEIEGATPAEVAPIVGLSAHATAALASRAREGLRQAFLQQHLKAEAPAGCRFTVEHLGSHVRDAVSDRDRAKVDEHLDGCGRCRRLRTELADVNGALRSIVAPALLGVGAHRYLAGSGGGAAGAGTASASGPSGRRVAMALAGVGAVGLLVFGGLALSRADDTDSTPEAAAVAAPASAAAADEQGTSAAATDAGARETLALPGSVIVEPVDGERCEGGDTVLPAALAPATGGATVVDTVLFRGDVAGLPPVTALTDAAGPAVRSVSGEPVGVLRDLSESVEGGDGLPGASCLTVPVASLLTDGGPWRLLIGYTSPTLRGLRYVVVDRVLPVLDGVRGDLAEAATDLADTLATLPAVPESLEGVTGTAAATTGGSTGGATGSGSLPAGGGGGSSLPVPLPVPTPTAPSTGGGGGGAPLGLDELLPPLPTDGLTDPLLGGQGGL